MARPDVTEPPGEEMYRLMGLEGASASRKRSWAVMEVERGESISPESRIIRSYNESSVGGGDVDDGRLSTLRSLENISS